MKKELTMYYRKMKSKLQERRIYILKKHLRLLRAVMEIKNNEISIQTIKASLVNGKMTSRSSYDGQDEAAMMVQSSDQSERAVNSGGVTRDLPEKVVRDQTTSVRVNLATADATSEVTRARLIKGEETTMQEIRDEEDRLKAEYKRLMYIRDRCAKADENRKVEENDRADTETSDAQVRRKGRKSYQGIRRDGDTTQLSIRQIQDRKSNNESEEQTR